MGKEAVVHISVQFSSVTQSCLTLCDPMDYSLPSFPVHHQLSELAPTHVHWLSDAIQPSHSLLSPSPPAFNLSQNQGLFQESVVHTRWPKYWSFSFSISISNEDAVLFPLGWTDWIFLQSKGLLSLLQYYSSKASILRHSAFFIVQLSHLYMITGKKPQLWQDVPLSVKWCLLFNVLSRLVIAFLSRGKQLNFMDAVTICSDIGGQE